MKIKGLLWFIALVTVLLVITLVIYLNNMKEEPIKEEVKEIKDIKSLYYTYSVGYAMNSDYTYDLNCEDECIIKIKPNGYSEEEAKTYNLDEEKIKEIIDVLNRYEVSKWDGFKKNDPNVLDGDSFSFSLHTKGELKVSASGYMMWPEHYRDVREAFKVLFEDFINEDFKDK